MRPRRWSACGARATSRSASSGRHRSITCNVAPDAQVPRELGGHADVGELGGRQHRRTAAPDLLRLGTQVDALHGPQVTHTEQRRLGPPGRARGEADRRRSVVVVGERGRGSARARRAPRPGHRATSTATSDRSGSPSTVVGAASTSFGRDQGHQVPALGRGDRGADAGDHRADRARATAATSQSPPEGSATATTSPSADAAQRQAGCQLVGPLRRARRRSACRRGRRPPVGHRTGWPSPRRSDRARGAA